MDTLSSTKEARIYNDNCASIRLRKDLRRPLSLHLRLILSTETTYNFKKTLAILGERGESDFQSFHIITFKYPVFSYKKKKKKKKAYKETIKYEPFKGKKISRN